MNTQPIEYKAKAFEPRNLGFFFLIAMVYPILLDLLNFSGLLEKMPSGLNDPVLIPWVLLYLPVILGPSFAAFVVTALTEGKPGVRALWKRFWNRNLSVKWLLVALLCLPILRSVAGILTQILYYPSYPLLQEGGISAVITGISLGLFSGLREEFGWRGYALPRFQAKWNALTSSMVLGVLTGLWHLPAFFTPGEPLFGANFWVWFPWHMLIQIVGYTWIFNNTNGNILALVLFHITTSVGIFNLDVRTYIGVMLLAAILIVVIFGPKDLVRRMPEEAIGQERVRVAGG